MAEKRVEMEADLRAAVETEWARLQADHTNLRTWTLALSEDRASWNPCGSCYSETRRIVLYPAVLARFREAVEEALDTLRHEAAHALRGPGGVHDAAWRQWAVCLGATPRARMD